MLPWSAPLTWFAPSTSALEATLPVFDPSIRGPILQPLVLATDDLPRAPLPCSPGLPIYDAYPDTEILPALVPPRLSRDPGDDNDADDVPDYDDNEDDLPGSLRRCRDPTPSHAAMYPIERTRLHPDAIASVLRLRSELACHITPVTPTAYPCAQPLRSHVLDARFIAALRSTLSDDDADAFMIILDTGCSFAMTFDLNDFIGPPVYQDWGEIKTAASTSLPMAALGVIRWRVMTEKGEPYNLQIPGFYVPGLTNRLLSPQDYCTYHGLKGPTEFGGNGSSFWMNLCDRTSRLVCSVDPKSHIPVALAYPSTQKPCDCQQCVDCQVGSANVASMFDPSNENLSATQKQLLLDHCRLGHFSMAHIKSLYKNNVEIDVLNDVVDCSDSRSGEPCLPCSHRGIQSCNAPMCAACQLAKGKKRKSSPMTKHSDPNRTMSLKRNDLHPGENVSIDQYESSARGRLPQTFGRESYDRKYGGGTIFVDHATGFTRVYHQTTLSAEETINSKEQF
jgi:hypothetical protein